MQGQSPRRKWHLGGRWSVRGQDPGADRHLLKMWADHGRLSSLSPRNDVSDSGAGREIGSQQDEASVIARTVSGPAEN